MGIGIGASLDPGGGPPLPVCLLLRLLHSGFFVPNSVLSVGAALLMKEARRLPPLTYQIHKTMNTTTLTTPVATVESPSSAQGISNLESVAQHTQLKAAFVFPTFRADSKKLIVTDLRSQGMARSEAEAWFNARLTAAAAAVTANRSAVSLKQRKNGDLAVVYRDTVAAAALKSAKVAAAKIAKLEAKIAELKKA